MVVLVVVALGLLAALTWYLGRRLADHANAEIEARVAEPLPEIPLRPKQPTSKLDPLLAKQPGFEEITSLGAEVERWLAIRPGYIQISVGSAWKGGNDGLAILKQMERVHELTLDCPQIDDGGVRHLLNLKSLMALHLRRTHFTARAVRELRVVPHLHLLTLAESNATDETLAAISDFDLGWLIIESPASVTDEGLKWIGFQRQLVSLRMASPGVTGATLGELAYLDNLRELVLSGTSVDDDGVAKLTGLDRLHSLDLSKTQVCGESLASLSRLPKLRELLLEDTAVDDHVLPQLASLATLEFLSLDGTRVTDGGLRHLSCLPSLRYVSLCRTATTASAIESLRQTSGLAVYVDSADAPTPEPRAKPE